MKTVGFQGEITSNGQIAVPPAIAAQVPAGEPVEVVLRWGNNEEDAAWRENARRRFESVYAPEDSVYEQLMNDTQTG